MDEQEQEALLETLSEIVEVLEWSIVPGQAKNIGKYGLGFGPSGHGYRETGPEGVPDPSKILSNLLRRLENIKVALGAALPRPPEPK